jgi:bud site selection protein 31
MPKIRTLKTKKAPKGFEDILPVLDEFEKQMKDTENAPLDAQRKVEHLWKITQIHHQRSRYIYELFYAKKEISRELYDFLLQEKYADANLIGKWKKNGF